VFLTEYWQADSFFTFLTFEAGHILKVVLKLWSNLRLNVLMNFVLKKKKKRVYLNMCTWNRPQIVIFRGAGDIQ